VGNVKGKSITPIREGTRPANYLIIKEGLAEGNERGIPMWWRKTEREPSPPEG